MKQNFRRIFFNKYLFFISSQINKYIFYNLITEYLNYFYIYNKTNIWNLTVNGDKNCII